MTARFENLVLDYSYLSPQSTGQVKGSTEQSFNNCSVTWWQKQATGTPLPLCHRASDLLKPIFAAADIRKTPAGTQISGPNTSQHVTVSSATWAEYCRPAQRDTRGHNGTVSAAKVPQWISTEPGRPIEANGRKKLRLPRPLKSELQQNCPKNATIIRWKTRICFPTTHENG